MQSSDYNLLRSQHGLAEVMDRDNRSLMVMRVSEIHRQLLPHRSVVVLVFRQDGKLYLQKRSHKKNVFPGRWDISTYGHVRPFEGTVDTAERKLEHELNIKADRLKFVRHLAATPGTGFEFTSLYALERVNEQVEPNPQEVGEGYFYSAEEIQYLVREFRELLTPRLVYLWEEGIPFPVWESV